MLMNFEPLLAYVFEQLIFKSLAVIEINSPHWL